MPSPSLLLLPLLALFPAASNAQVFSGGGDTPEVSLLTDTAAFNESTLSKITLRSVLDKINAGKSAETKFYFGSSIHNQYTHPSSIEWTKQRFTDTFNIAVAENDCKWYSTEPTRGGYNVAACKALNQYALDRGIPFRGHSTFWHSQRPQWLIDGTSNNLINLNDLKNIIPNTVSSVMEGVGGDVISWDTVNEPWTDSGSSGMTETQCVVSANRWPNLATTGDTSSAKLFPDSSFIDLALNAAAKSRTKLGKPNMKLFVNDYNVGGNNPSAAKTECAFKTLTRLQNAKVPVDGLGIQSHYSARPGSFPTKASAHETLDKLKSMGLLGAITEMDIWVPDLSKEAERYQASIFGDILDTCLYSSNCNEFLVWNTRDDESWLNDFAPVKANSSGTLFDSNGNPKLAYYEVLARLKNYADGGKEPCATSDGKTICTISSSTPPAVTSATSVKPSVTSATSVKPSVTSTTSTASVPSTTTSPPSTGVVAKYGQCGGQGYSGPTTCIAGSTCTFSNQWYSQCL